MKNFFYLFLLSLFCATSAIAEDEVFTYAPEQGNIALTGAGKYVWNDMAILLKDPGYVGYEVVGISVNVPVVDGCACDPAAKAWLAHELVVDQTTYDCVPDIVADGEISNYGTEDNPVYRLDVTFPEPYILTEEGIYVGYSLKVTALKQWTAKYPLEIITNPNSQGGMFVHFGYSTTSSLPAQDKNKMFLDLSGNGTVSTMRVILRGNKAENDAAIAAPESIFGLYSEVKSVDATITNYGSKPIEEIGYTLTPVGGEENEFSGNITLPAPIASSESAIVSFPIEMPAEHGDFDYNLTITDVNGTPNKNVGKTTLFTALSRPFIPHKRVLIEEYTGLWCGYCPESYVAIKQITEKRPDDVVVIAFHQADRLMTISSADMPDPNAGEPAIRLDRLSRQNPFKYCDRDVASHLNVLAPADLDVDLYWADDSRRKLRAVANLHFVDPAEADQYRLAYALVEDDMSDPSWGQRNFFNDASLYTDDWYKTKYWDLFLGKEYDVPGIVFDDVALQFPNCLGIAESVPAVEIGEKYHHSAIVNPDEVSGKDSLNEGQNIIRNRNKLRVVAVLLDSKTGKAVNAASSCYAVNLPVYDDELVNVENIPSESASAVVCEEYYSISGVRLPQMPEKGAVIVVRHLENGETKTAKIMQ